MIDLVAQLVEQMTLNHWVEGSSPSQVTKKHLAILQDAFFMMTTLSIVTLYHKSLFYVTISCTDLNRRALCRRDNGW